MPSEICDRLQLLEIIMPQGIGKPILVAHHRVMLISKIDSFDCEELIEFFLLQLLANDGATGYLVRLASVAKI